ncbi:unnamed protein product [Rotaria sp. Silwood2]|nr:unnamed protein product [Rotaria sp. Silwood2]
MFEHGKQREEEVFNIKMFIGTIKGREQQQFDITNLNNEIKCVNIYKQDIEKENRQTMNILIKPHQQNNLLNELMDQTYDKEEEHYKIESNLTQLIEQNNKLCRQF